MSMSQLLFSFQGRLNRKPYWLTNIAISVLVFVCALLAVALGIGFGLGDSTLPAVFVAAAVIGILLFWISLALGAKRLHDRNKSAWWLVLFYVVPGLLGAAASELGTPGLVLHLISFAITVWAFVELGCLRGTVGPNAYGPDPLEPVGQAATGIPGHAR